MKCPHCGYNNFNKLCNIEERGNLIGLKYKCNDCGITQIK